MVQAVASGDSSTGRAYFEAYCVTPAGIALPAATVSGSMETTQTITVGATQDFATLVDGLGSNTCTYLEGQAAGQFGTAPQICSTGLSRLLVCISSIRNIFFECDDPSFIVVRTPGGFNNGGDVGRRNFQTDIPMQLELTGCSTVGRPEQVDCSTNGNYYTYLNPAESMGFGLFSNEPCDGSSNPSCLAGDATLSSLDICTEVITTAAPTGAPSASPSVAPITTAAPTVKLSASPSLGPTSRPTFVPTMAPTSGAPTNMPTSAPSSQPTSAPASSVPTATPVNAVPGETNGSPSASHRRRVWMGLALVVSAAVVVAGI